MFAGGWDLEAAEAVCAGDGIDGAEVLELYSTDPSHSDAMALLQRAADHVERAGDEVYGFFRRTESARAVLPELAEHHVVHRRATLEDVFLRLTGRELRE